MSTIALLAPEAIEAAYDRMAAFMALNGGDRPQSDAFEALDALGASVGLDAEGRSQVVRLYRRMQPERRRNAGAVLVGFMLGLMARQEADGHVATAPLTDADIYRELLGHDG